MAEGIIDNVKLMLKTLGVIKEEEEEGPETDEIIEDKSEINEYSSIDKSDEIELKKQDIDNEKVLYQPIPNKSHMILVKEYTTV
jgi:hypothetical protein